MTETGIDNFLRDKPQCILLFSGKRKCGKDYITEKLYERVGEDRSLIMRISAPIKSHWATQLGLNLDELAGAGEYKERYRLQMIQWSEEVRAKDYGYFCRAAVEMFEAKNKVVWIVSDTRRRTDLKWFREHFGDVVKTIRIKADDNVRRQRGLVFTEGVDDVASECDLDSVTNWDLEVTNNGASIEQLDNTLASIVSLVDVTCSQPVLK